MYISNGNKITGAYSEAETKKATIKLLRTIVVLTQTLKPLPDDVMMTMKLLYHDNGELLATYAAQSVQRAYIMVIAWHNLLWVTDRSTVGDN